MLNIIQLQDRLKNAPDDYLLNEMKRPSGSVPQYLVLTEMQRRKSIRDGSAPALPQDSRSIADRLSEELTDINQTSPDYTAMPQPQMDLPTEPPADYTRGPQGYHEGGIVALGGPTLPQQASPTAFGQIGQIFQPAQSTVQQGMPQPAQPTMNVALPPTAAPSTPANPVINWQPMQPQQKPTGGPRGSVYGMSFAEGGLVQNPSSTASGQRPWGNGFYGGVFDFLSNIVGGGKPAATAASQGPQQPGRIAQAPMARNPGFAQQTAQFNPVRLMAPTAPVSGAAGGSTPINMPKLGQAQMARMASGGIVRLADGGGVSIGQHRPPLTLEEYLAARRGRFNPNYREGTGIQSTPGPIRGAAGLFMDYLGKPLAESLRLSASDAAAERRGELGPRQIAAVEARNPDYPAASDDELPAVDDTTPAPMLPGPYADVTVLDMDAMVPPHPAGAGAKPGAKNAVAVTGGTSSAPQLPKELMDMMKPGEDPYARFADKLANYEEQALKDRSYDRWMGVAQMGLGMMNNSNPNFLSAVGQGVQSGMPAMAAAEKDYRDRTFKTMGVDLAIQDARTKLAQGNRSAAIELYKTALQSDYQNRSLDLQRDKLNQMPDLWRMAEKYAESSPEMKDAIKTLLTKDKGSLDHLKLSLQFIKANLDTLSRDARSTVPGTKEYQMRQALMARNAALDSLLSGISDSPIQ